MVLFANDPPAYREAMSRAVAERTGLPVATLPGDRLLEEQIAARAASVVVTSVSEQAAIRLSQQVLVVNLSHDPRERAAVYREGKSVWEGALQGLEDLAALIEDLTPAGQRG